MTFQGYFFNTLKEFLEWFEKEWYTFEEPLYTLIDYLNWARYLWLEVHCLPEE